MRHIGNVHPELPIAPRRSFQAKGVVKILRVLRVNRHHGIGTAVQAPCQVARPHLGSQRPGFLQHFPGKMKGKLVLPDDRQHVHPLGVRRAQNLNHFAFRVGVACLPLPQLDHDLVAHPRRASDILRWRHVNIVRDAGVVRNDVKKLAAALQGAHQPGARPVQHPDDPAGLLGRHSAASPPRHRIPSHQHAVAMEGGGGGVGRNSQHRQLGIVRLEKAGALAVHADAAGDQVGLQRQPVAFSLLEPRHPSLAFQPLQDAPHLEDTVRGKPKFGGQFSHGQRGVTRPAQQIQNSILHHQPQLELTRRMPRGRSGFASYTGYMAHSCITNNRRGPREA